MDYKEFKDALETLDWASYHLEETYTENEGEVTEETEKLEAEIEAIRQLLNTDGVDFLGRWLKEKEDRKKTIKAEKDFLTRQIEGLDRSIEFIKGQIRTLMDETGCEKVKGSLGYSFATSVSKKTEVDKELLNEYFKGKVEEAVRPFLPADVTVTLGASVSRLEEDAPLPSWYHITETPTVRFTKPRSKKED